VSPLVLNSVYNASVRAFPECVWLVLVFALVGAEASLYLAFRAFRRNGGGKKGGKDGGKALLASIGEDGDEERQMDV
jgi:hypothetical protein